MEFSKTQIALLVLGYLKSERCLNAFEQFLELSQHLGDVKQQAKTDKYFITRVGGLSLVDYLEEYASIYSIVQGRLEASNYFSENQSRATLVDQLLYLLDNGGQNILNSTPITSESVEATHVDVLPGNQNPRPKQSKAKRKGCRSKEETMDVSQVLTQTILEHQFHEKIAQTINNVTQEIGNNSQNDSAGASKELDAIIKTVVQHTEKDPMYNKMLDEILGIPTENAKATTTSKSESPSFQQRETIDEHNIDAVHSIIAASSQTNAKCAVAVATTAPQAPHSSDVYVFDGNLDAYIKTSAVTNATNPLYINTGAPLVVVPPNYNNQPFKESDILAMPTVIVSDKAPPTERTRNGGRRKIVPKPVLKKVVSADSEKQLAAARNLNFASPTSDVAAPSVAKKTVKGDWDADLRSLFATKSPAKKTPCKPKKKPATKKSKKEKQNDDAAVASVSNDDQSTKSSDGGHHDDNEPEKGDPESERVESESEKAEPESEKNEPESKTTPLTPDAKTPLKQETLPKTPGVGLPFGTPFNDVIDEHLRGVDLTSIATPKLPITPGFALTPNFAITPNIESGCCNRPTDYSTSSSYYQPSDTEQNKSIEQMLEECKKVERVTNNCAEHLQHFNQNVIGKKNLNLIKPSESSLISETCVTISSDSEQSDYSEPVAEKTVICRSETKTSETISEIISTVEITKSVEHPGVDKTELLSHLNEVKQRTLNKLRKESAPKVTKRPPRILKRAPKIPAATKKPERGRKSRRVEPETTDTEKLVNGLKERGIHLIPNKSPVTNKSPVPKKSSVSAKSPVQHKKEEVNLSSETVTADELSPASDGLSHRVYETFEIVKHNERFRSRKTYDLEILKNSFKARLFDEDLQEQVDTVVAWTPFAFFTTHTHEIVPFKSPKKQETPEEMEENDMRDFSLAVNEDSPPPLNEVKNKAKRKRKSTSAVEEKRTEKKIKTSVNLKLLNEIGVDDFLDKVHGE